VNQEIPDFQQLKSKPETIDRELDNFDFDEHLDNELDKILQDLTRTKIKDSTLRNIREIKLNGN